MKDERKEFGETERQQLAFFSKILKERRKHFEQADTQLWLAQNQNQNDLLQLMDISMQWMEKAKSGSQTHKDLESNIYAIMRIESYCRQQETVSKASVAEFIEERKRNERLNSELRLLRYESEKEIENLKKEIDGKNKEIEFINSSKK